MGTKVKKPRMCPLCKVKHIPGEHLSRLERLHQAAGRALGEQPGVNEGDWHGAENNLSGGVESRHAVADNTGKASPQSTILMPANGRPGLLQEPPGQLATPVVKSVERDNASSESSASPAQTTFFQEKGGDAQCLTETPKQSEVAETVQPASATTNGSVPQLEPGVYERVDPSIYHRQYSFSRGDMLLAAVPAKLKYAKDHPQTEKPTPAKVIGNAFHAKLLEPEVFDARYVLSRFAEFRTNEAKNWRDEQTKKGLTVLSREDIDMIDQMCMSCREQAHFHKVFARAGMRRELTVIAKDPATGLLLRARYDIVPGGNVLPDIKSAMDASPEGFGKAAWNMEYGAQAAHYLYVWNLAHPNNQRREFVFLVQEKDPPYLSNMFITPYSLIEYWDRILRARRYVIAQCLKTGVWPGYEVHPLERSEFELPRFAVVEIERSAENG